MKYNISQPASRACSGCGACAATCQKEAVQLRLDAAGFYTANVDEAQCIHCGLCKRVCLRYEDGIEAGVSLYDVPLYALQSSDPSIVKTSSSGGIAHELAIQALRRGEKTVGAVYNIQTDRVEHRVAAEQGQARAFAGSKYLQSDPSEAFRQALQDARIHPEARYAVTGTPCQIVGMAKAAMQAHVRDQFLLIEIFCHGVPSYKLWDAECEKIRRKLKAERFDAVQFRYKKNDWHSYCLKVDAGEKSFFGERETMLFWQVFFENILLGDSCYTCEARKDRSLADIRLGDYWGRRFQHRSDGVSAAFACTERGRAVLEELVDEGTAVQLESADVAEMLAAQNMQGYSQTKLHDDALEKLRTGDIREAVAYYRSRQSRRQKMKRFLLYVSAMIPSGLRGKLRKANSSRQLRKQ